jgi:hypothetical protein
MTPLPSPRYVTAALFLLWAAPAVAQDSAFHLATDDPARSPSPFIGNGRIGVVIPALGIGSSHSFVAGLYEHAPSDVPRIAVVPAWNAIGVFDGERWLDTSAVAAGAVREYRQVLDMRTGTARTGYDWIDGARRTTIGVETFVSRADSHLAAVRLDLTPSFKGRMRVRFAIAGRPPPRRLSLATLPRADPQWRPADIWYPGHMVVRSRTATRVPKGARLSLTATPEGRTTVLAQAAAVGWPTDLPHAEAHTRSTGDTALVEVAFDAVPGRTYTFTHVVSFATSATDARAPGRASREA